jgi:hemerythrin-like domain-containing protein
MKDLMVAMLPISPLMVEHRIIERMIDIMKDEIKSLKASEKPDAVFIDTAVDFFRTYADATHHGKEEDILFRELKKKELILEHRAQMEDLINDHIIGRKAVAELVNARDKYFNGDANAVKTILERMQFLTEFYPKHIEKEDKHFFIPVMGYFSPEEQQALLEEGHAFDRKMIHKKYDKLVGDLEWKRDIAPPKRPPDWLDFM